jgi:hypothetical protein
MAKKAKKTVRRGWTKEDDRSLKAHSKSRTRVVKVAKDLKRTMSAVRQRAFGLGIAIGHQR